VTTPVQADDHRAALAAEYGRWVAVEPIDIGGARAFNVGDPVPVGHVESGVVPKSAVTGVNTKAAAAVLTEKG
jgi:hypothetical protein